MTSALLIDFGGVLTTDPFASFNDFCATAGLPPDSVTRCLREDPEALALLIDFETGKLDEAGFESGFARCLGVAPERLVDRLMGGLRPKPEMLAAVARLRAAGAVTVLLSNSIGMRAYEGYGLDDLFDHQVVSEAVGMRKPSAEMFALGAERAGVAPEACVFVDDLEHNVRAARALGMAAIHHREPAETIRRLDEAFA
jgi:epoxide hydrolase-like predicted phosphatase